MAYKVCVMTGTRAEYGLLRNLIFKIKEDEDLKLELLVTGAHLSEKFGNTQTEIIDDGLSFYKVLIPVDSDSKNGMANNTGEAIVAFSNYFNNNKPDIVVVLGDRYEAFATATAAYIQSIPIAHISGGDVTEGALDDGFRHCITKMSSLHFPGCDDSARRIIQMGEQPDSVYSIGDPGVENCFNTDFWNIEKLEDNLKFKLYDKKYGVVTFHPVTQEEDTAIKQLKELIKAMDYFENMQFIITTANADAGGRAINTLWDKESETHPNWYVTTSLGLVRYLSAVKHSAVVIGNSSSGVVEAPALGIPTVNIGDRQKGRPIAESVICCSPEYTEIKNAISIAVSEEFKNIAENCESPFGKGETSTEIVRIIKDVLKNNNINFKKKFYDIEFEV